MDILPDPQFWGRLLEISFLNLLLSGDNAVVIALAVRGLPRRMRLLGQIWGTVGAVVLRLLFVGIVAALLQIPLLRLIGSLLLLWIAVRLVRPNEEAESTGRHGTSFWESVWIIIVADITMSLDNVLAVAGAAKDHPQMLIFGLILSVALMGLAANFIAQYIERYRWIAWIGLLVILWVAVKMIWEGAHHVAPHIAPIFG